MYYVEADDAKACTLGTLDSPSLGRPFLGKLPISAVWTGSGTILFAVMNCSWKFNGDVGEGTKSIPYQLQRLFIHLQVRNPIVAIVSTHADSLPPLPHSLTPRLPLREQ